MSNQHDNFLDNLPTNWTYDRLKDVVTLRNEKSLVKSGEMDYLELEDIESGTGKILSRRNSLDVASAVTIFKKNDVLFGKLRPYLEKYYQAEFDGRCTGEILAFKPNRITSRFLFYCVGSRWFIERCNALAYGAKMPRINWSTQLSQFNLPLPPEPEQKQISTFLDSNCRVIDSVIATKRRQLETLDVLYKSVLHAAFNYDEWPVERIKDITTKIGSGVTPDGGATGYLNEGIPLIRSQNVHFDGLRLDDVAYISNETHAHMANSQIKTHDVLLNITGASIGRCTFVPDNFGEGNVNQHVCIIRGNHKIDHRFLAAFFSSPIGQGQIFSSFTGASRQGLGQRELGYFKIPLPSLSVQYNVVEGLKKFNSRRNQVRINLESQISTIISYRSSLIHEFVTGRCRIDNMNKNLVKIHG